MYFGEEASITWDNFQRIILLIPPRNRIYEWDQVLTVLFHQRGSSSGRGPEMLAG